MTHHPTQKPGVEFIHRSIAQRARRMSERLKRMSDAAFAKLGGPKQLRFWP
jgi:hypothetical protein